MMAAAQPFLSGGISKTVNLPHDATVEDISRTYRLAHTLGIKCVALFRDNCKASQPMAGASQDRLNERHPHVRKAIDALAVAGGASPGMSLADTREALSKPRHSTRRRMPTVANSRRVKFSVGGHEGYLHLGMHEDGSLGEVFVRMAKEGSTVSGLLDAWATMVSIALQYGAPLETLCEKMVGTTYAPHGFTLPGEN
jgi:ribonucleoside-diphosphate reductase alpha chain